jgi:hypothetical protein
VGRRSDTVAQPKAVPLPSVNPSKSHGISRQIILIDITVGSIEWMDICGTTKNGSAIIIST